MINEPSWYKQKPRVISYDYQVLRNDINFTKRPFRLGYAVKALEDIHLSSFKASKLIEGACCYDHIL